MSYPFIEDTVIRLEHIPQARAVLEILGDRFSQIALINNQPEPPAKPGAQYLCSIDNLIDALVRRTSD